MMGLITWALTRYTEPLFLPHDLPRNAALLTVIIFGSGLAYLVSIQLTRAMRLQGIKGVLRRKTEQEDILEED